MALHKEKSTISPAFTTQFSMESSDEKKYNLEHMEAMIDALKQGLCKLEIELKDYKITFPLRAAFVCKWNCVTFKDLSCENNVYELFLIF